ncbi:hypothetical protein [Phenylobacterium sp.]|nr:hypothetical protein [Phenylobacterium sp.]
MAIRTSPLSHLGAYGVISIAKSPSTASIVRRPAAAIASFFPR